MGRNSENEKKRQQILDYINGYYDDFREIPSVRDIAAGTGISTATVHRHLTVMKENGELQYAGRRAISTDRMKLEGGHLSMPVLGCVACGPGEEETEELIEYIRMPESIVGKGNLYALIAKGESMTGAGIFPGDYVIVNRDRQAEPGDIVVAHYGGYNNLKVLKKDEKKGVYVLESRNPDKEKYADIYPHKFGDFTIQGVAVCVSHRLGRI